MGKNKGQQGDGDEFPVLSRAEKKRATEQRLAEVDGVNALRLRAFWLRRLGWTVDQVAQALSVSITSVKRWDKAGKQEFGEMPTVRCSKDAIQTLLPKAIAVAERSLDSADPKIAWDAAKTFLNSFEVMVEKTQDVTGASDSELVAKAERILALAKRRSTTEVNTDGAGQAEA